MSSTLNPLSEVSIDLLVSNVKSRVLHNNALFISFENTKRYNNHQVILEYLFIKNFDIKINILHHLQLPISFPVISRSLTPPENQNVTDSYSANVPTLSSLALAHNYTDCCISANVTKNCLGFCSIQTILEGTGQDPESCQPDFPAIVK